MHHVKLPTRYLSDEEVDARCSWSAEKKPKKVELFFEGDFSEGSWDIENLQDENGNPIKLTQNIYWFIQDSMEGQQPDRYWDKYA